MSKKNPIPVDTDQVRQQLERGQYFEEARVWYDELYHRLLGERSFFILITFMAALTILLSTLVYSSMFPVNRLVPYIITTKDLAEDMPFVHRLKYAPGEDLNVSVARFLAANYVQLREEYKYDVSRLEQNFNRLRNTTGDSEFEKYQESVSPQNPASPFNKYGRDIVRTTKVADVRLDLSVEPRQAQIFFSTLLVDGLNQQQENWQASIVFDFPELTVDPETNKVLQWKPEQNSFEEASEINFVVQSYTTQQLGQY